ncbi:MAG: CRTAC1 family protein [Cyanobacteriota bacterium]
MFQDCSSLIRFNPAALHYGVAVCDLDRDGAFELFVCGFRGPNRVLKWDGQVLLDQADDILADAERMAIGVAAADFDGDGQEELYVLNTDTFGGRKRFGDRLFDWQESGWVDLFTLPQNQDALNLTAGRSVVCIDRLGQGRYGFFVANYGGPMRLYELTPEGMIADVAPEAGLNRITGGRGGVAVPLVSQRMDLFAVNEQGANFLFRNCGDGTFVDIAPEVGLQDPFEHGRGVAAVDLNGDGQLDLVYGNWEGPHRLWIQTATGVFKDIAPPELAKPSRIRTVIAADFDNDGYPELFFNNIGQPNRLFAFRSGNWQAIDIGEAAEPNGLGTGAAVADWDGDGRLELLIAHGETAPQPLSVYRPLANANNWLRVLPFTRQGSPARGAVVKLVTSTPSQEGVRLQVQAIDAGSGYLCQMEPVAHFGLGTEAIVEEVQIRWPDGEELSLAKPPINQLLRVPHPSAGKN